MFGIHSAAVLDRLSNIQSVGLVEHDVLPESDNDASLEFLLYGDASLDVVCVLCARVSDLICACITGFMIYVTVCIYDSSHLVRGTVCIYDLCKSLQCGP